MKAPWVALVGCLCMAALAEARRHERPTAPGLSTPASQRAPHFTDGPGHGLTGPCGILVHGCHLQADAWESIMWGDIGTQQLGRIPRAILTAREQNAEIGATRFQATAAAARRTPPPIHFQATIAVAATFATARRIPHAKRQTPNAKRHTSHVTRHTPHPQRPRPPQ